MPSPIEQDAAVTVEKLQKADVTNNFRDVFNEIKNDARQYTSAQFQDYLRNVNDGLAQKGYLPNVTIVGFDIQNNKLSVQINGNRMDLDERSAVNHLDKRTLETNLRRNPENPANGDNVVSKQLPDGRLLKMDDKGRVVEAVNPGVGKVTYTRDSEGKVVEAVTTNTSGQVTKTERMEAGKWVSIEGRNRKEIADVTKVDVNKNGETVIKTGSGQVVQKPSDGSTITYDQSGNVTKIDYKGGGSRTFAYENGQLKSVDYTDGRGYKDSYKLQPDGTWQNFDSNGRATAHKLNKVSVSADGRVSEKGKDASGRDVENVIGTDHQKIDATKTKVNPDNSRVTVENGKITDVVSPNGTKKHFEYAADGKLSKMEITDRGGTQVWERNGDTWKQRGTANEHTGVATVDRNGNLEVKFPNGSSVIQRADGGSITKNERQHITSITDRNGVKRDFKYDNEGKLSEIKYTNGSFSDTWKREGDTWNNYDANGRATGKALGNIGLRQDGTLIEHDKNTNRATISRPDGSSETRKVPAGVDLSRDRLPGEAPPPSPADRTQPPPTRPRHDAPWHEHRRHAMQTQKDEITANGSRKIQQGDTLWDIARANLELQNSGSRTPSAQDVSQEVRRLAQVNGIRDVNRIPIGTEIKMRNR